MMNTKYFLLFPFADPDLPDYLVTANIPVNAKLTVRPRVKILATKKVFPGVFTGKPFLRVFV